MAIPKIRKIGHVKFIFIYRDVKTSMFLMMDDGRVFMEMLNSRHKQHACQAKIAMMVDDEIAWLTSEKINTFNKKMSKYQIDENTSIVYTSDYKYQQDPQKNTDLIFNLIDTVRQYTNSSFRYIDLGYVILVIKNSFNSKKIIPSRTEHTLREKFINQKRNIRSFCVVSRYINTTYDYLYEKKLCHWISDEFNEKINLMSRASRQRMKILSVGLFYMCVKAWNRENLRKVCGHDLKHKNYILKNIKVDEDS